MISCDWSTNRVGILLLVVYHLIELFDLLLILLAVGIILLEEQVRGRSAGW